MALEAATFIGDLNPANPDGADNKYDGDNHLRLVKATLQATLPGLIGRMGRTQTKTGTYTVVATDNMTVLSCDGTFQLDLTAAATLGNGHSFVVHATTGAITIDPAGAELINGAAAYVVPVGGVVTVSCNGVGFVTRSSIYALTAFALSLMDDVDATAARATLGVTIGSQVQAFDATLAALAGLTIAANSLTIGSGADAFSQVTFGANTFPGRASTGNLVAKPITDFGFSLIDDADATAGRTTLGLASMAVQDSNNVLIGGGTITGITDLSVNDGGTGASNASDARTNLGLIIGTHIQAFDTELAAIAGLTSAANQLPYFTGAGTAALTELSAFARTLLDDANAADAAFTLAVLPLAGGTMTGNLTLAGAPSSDLHAATKLYVDSVTSTGLKPTDSVVAATTGNITLSGEQTIDGVLTSADRVLVKNQSTPAQNGIYLSAAGAWSRTTDMDNWDEVPGLYTFVTGGTTQANTGWSCTSDIGGTLETTPITWAQFSSPGTYTASGGITLTGTNFTANIGTDIQAFDADLAAIAGLTSAADRLPYFTGAGTAALATFTGFARQLVDDTDATTMRSTLGLIIGTNVQAFDATLSAFAALTIAANTLTIGTGADAFSQTTFGANTFPGRSSSGSLVAKAMTDFGFSLVDDANAGAARTTLGLGTIATQNSDGVTITGGTISGITDLAIADGGTGAGTAADARTNLGLVIGTHVQAFDVELSALAGLTSAADKLPYFTGSGTAGLTDLSSFARTLLDDTDAVTMRITLGASDGSVPQNSQSAAYTTVLADANKHILHPVADNNPRTFTIDSNANVAYPIGTTISFVNEVNTLTIAITSDTMTLAGSSSTGNRTLSVNGIATALKIATTKWIINGTGLS